MTDNSAGYFEQSVVDVGSFFVSHSQAPKVMEPGEGALNAPATLSQSAAVGHAWLGQQGFDATLFQLVSMGLPIITAIALHALGTLARTTCFALNIRHLFKQRQQLGDIVAIGFSQNNTQRRAFGIA